MSGFDKYSNYDDKFSFSSVVFGSDKPILEVEMNELQQIIHSKISKILRCIGNKVLFLEPPTVSNFKVTFPSMLVLEENGGNVVEVKNVSVEYSTTNKEIYLEIEEKDVDYTSELHHYGNSQGDIVTNPIKDDRFPMETSRRKCLVYTLVAGTEVPSNTTTIKYIALATSNSNGTLTYKEYIGYNTLVEDSTSYGDITNYASIDDLVETIPNNTTFIGYVTTAPSWFPSGVDETKCLLRIVRNSTDRILLELTDTSDVTKNYVGGYSNEVFTGWYLISMTKVT